MKITSGRIGRMKLMTMMALGYLLTSFVGVPSVILRIIFICEKPMMIWDWCAKLFVNIAFGISPQAIEAMLEYTDSRTGRVPKSFWQRELEDGLMLTIAMYEGHVFSRFLRTIIDGKPTRQDLSPVFADELRQLGLEVSGKSVMAYTLMQIQNGTLLGASRLRCMAKGTPADSPSVPRSTPKREERPDASPPFDTQAPAVMQAEQMKNAGHESKKQRKGSRRPSEAIGVVKSAGNTTVRPENGSPYSSFQVVIQTDDAGDVIFSGVDLETKFNSGLFSIGDKVHIKKSIVTLDVEFDGEKKRRTKNDFQIEVLKA